MQRTTLQAFSDKNFTRKVGTQELAAASAGPPAFRKQLELCCIFPEVRKRRRTEVPAELRCGALRCVA